MAIVAQAKASSMVVQALIWAGMVVSVVGEDAHMQQVAAVAAAIPAVAAAAAAVATVQSAPAAAAVVALFPPTTMLPFRVTSVMVTER